MRQLIVSVLRKLKGVEVFEAEDGSVALKTMSQQRFDILLADINMPVMDGLKLVSLVRRDEKHCDIPIVIITTEGADADRERAMGLGATTYITKPIQAAQVVSCIRRLLDI